MDMMSFKDAVGLIVSLGTGIQTQWNLYLAVSASVFGLTKLSEAGDQPVIKMVFTIGFLVFAISNRIAIGQLQSQIHALVGVAKSHQRGAGSEIHQVVESFTPVRKEIGHLYHWMFTTIVLLGIWLIPAATTPFSK